MKKPIPFFCLEMWAEGVNTSMRLTETMVAVPAVVNARMPMIRAAASNPLTGDWPDSAALS